MKKRSKPAEEAGPLEGLGDGMVIRVADYEETFGIREDKKTVRKSPALYSRWYNSANDEASACYMRRIDKLTRRPDGLLLEGGWGRVLRAASNHDRAFGGFLTNDRSRAATVAEIAEGILFCDESTATEILSALLVVGLIEIVPELDWEERKSDLAAKADTARTRNTGGKGKGKSGGAKDLRPEGIGR